MKLQVCSIYDIVSQVFGPLMLFRSLGQAKREFTDACLAGKTFDHPEDCKLMHIGEFDDCTAQIEQLPHHILLMSGVKGGVDNVVPFVEQSSSSSQICE